MIVEKRFFRHIYQSQRAVTMPDLVLAGVEDSGVKRCPDSGDEC